VTINRRTHRLDRAILLLGVAAAMVGLGMITALLAEIQEEYGFEDWGLGLIAGASFATAFVSYLFLSKYSDRGHARLMFVGGGAIAALGLVWVAIAGSLWTFVGARALLGLGEGMFIPAARRIVLDWNPDEPGRELGTVHAAAVAGFIAGPAIGALLAEPFGLSIPFLVPAVGMLVAMPLVLRISPAPIRFPGGEGSMREVLRRPMVLSGLLIGSSSYFGVGAIDTVWARLLSDRGASTTFIGISFTLIVLPLAFLAPLGGRLADRTDPRVVGIAASIAIVPVFSSYGWLEAPMVIAAAGAIHSALMAGVNPAAAASVARGSPPEFVARGQGALDASGYVFAAVAAGLTGVLYGSLGPGWSITIVAAITLVLALLSYWVSRHELRGSVRRGAHDREELVHDGSG
jgi:MFS family permease